MVNFDLRDIDLASERDCYSLQDIINLRIHAQSEMLRCRRQATWRHEHMVTLALIWMLLLTFFGLSDFLGAFKELVVLALWGGGVFVMRRSAQHADDAYRYCAEVNLSFSEVCVEHYCEIDQLCRECPAVSRYVDRVAASGRVLTYYELRKLAQWAEVNRTEKRLRKSIAHFFGRGLGWG